MSNQSIYWQLKDAGTEIDHHESDLYVKRCPTSQGIVETYRFKEQVTTFRSQRDGCFWYEIPFAYDPYWERRLSG